MPGSLERGGVAEIGELFGLIGEQQTKAGDVLNGGFGLKFVDALSKLVAIHNGGNFLQNV